MAAAAIILCGGKSSRMGRAKAWLPWRGQPMVAHVVSFVRPVVDEVVANIDIAPTIMEAAGVEMPKIYHGVKQQPLNGVSMIYSFDDADAPNRKERQYSELFGTRALWSDGRPAVTKLF